MKIQNFKDRQKLKVLDRFLQEPYALVQVSTSLEGVEIPVNLKDEPIITLSLSRNFKGALELLSDRIEADLLFGDNYYRCILPYGAILGAMSESGEQVSWRDDSEDVVANQNEAAEQPVLLEAPFDVEQEEPSSEKPENREIRKGHLRRVK